MEMKENTVYLSTAAYNQIKADNQKFHMFLERMMESAKLSKDKARVEFDSELLSEVIHLVYPEAYKKKLSYLRGQDTREAMRLVKEQETRNDE